MAPPHSIASLTISFGLVSIPVNLFSATESNGTIKFHMLHKTCGSRVKQQLICIKEDVPVERADTVKGYEFAKNQYVAFTPEEIKALEAVGTQSIDISEFVPLQSIDPVFFDKTYYLAPDKGGAKPYALLTRALLESSLCAIGHYAARGKEYLVSLRAVETVLVMQQLHFADEVRAASEFAVPGAVKDAELKLARQLIDQQATKAFDPSAYEDQVRTRILKEIDKKVKGEEISIAEAPERPSAQVIDIMAALKASLGKTAKREPAKLGIRKGPQRATSVVKPARRATKR